MNISLCFCLHRRWRLAAFFAAIQCGARAGGAWQAGLDLSLEATAGGPGGTRQGHALHGLALAYADWAQTETKAADFRLTGRLSALALAGRGPTERFLGDFLAASNSEGHRSVRLYSSWIEAGRGSWSVRGGTLLADEEFAGTAAGGCFFNSAFGWPAFVSANTLNTGPAFYVATLGVRVEHRWSETTTWRLGLYDGDAFDSPTGDPAVTRHGLHHQVGGDQGWFLMSEGTFALTGGATRLKASPLP
jgi:porin